MGKRLQDLTVAGVPLSGAKLDEMTFVRSTSWHGFHRVRVNGIAGTLYRVDESPADMRERFGTFGNVVILSGHSQYAPEQRRTFVFVGDKRFTRGA